MKELIKAMATDMNIEPYANETQGSFLYRLCYSAFGLWCLKTAENKVDGKEGTTKHNQTTTINTLLCEYGKLFPSIANMFLDQQTMPEEFAVHIRKVYEETGYLLTNDENKNRIARCGRGVHIGDETLFFGLKKKISSVNGLGVFAGQAEFYVDISDVLIRDNLSPHKYFEARYTDIDFYEKDMAIDELEFFDSTAKTVPSAAWKKQPNTEFSVARKSELGSYYRVIRAINGTLTYAEEAGVTKGSGLTDCEYRRLYFALKEHYNNPLTAKIEAIDNVYSKINIRGHLPNREYYFMLLLSWPSENAFEKCKFIIKKAHTPTIKSMLNNIGIEVQGA
jgi:hypothetical protein